MYDRFCAVASAVCIYGTQKFKILRPNLLEAKAKAAHCRGQGHNMLCRQLENYIRPSPFIITQP